MASEAKTLQLIARVASVYCRIDYELDLSNRHAIVLRNVVKYYLMLGGNERRPKCDVFEKLSFPSEARNAEKNCQC